jgi:hypothetical protein
MAVIDRRMKYLDISNAFHNQANEVALSCKQSQRTCEKLAKQLASRRAKTSEEFEKIETMKDFVIRTAEMNERVLKLLDYMNGLLLDVADDSKVLIEGAVLRDKLADQSECLEMLMQERDNAVKQVYECRKDQINSK